MGHLRLRYEKKTIERAARVYGSNKDAAPTIGIQPGSFERFMPSIWGANA